MKHTNKLEVEAVFMGCIPNFKNIGPSISPPPIPKVADNIPDIRPIIGN